MPTHSFPAGFRTASDGSLICRHRDLSVCPECAAHPAVTEVVGAHFFDPDGSVAAEVAEILAEAG